MRANYRAISTSEAGAIVREIVGPRHERKVLKAIAESIITANREHAEKWGLRLRPGNIMLKVGFVEVLQVTTNEFRELLEKRSILSRMRKDPSCIFDPRAPYKNAPGCVGCEMDHSAVWENYRVFQPAHAAALRIASKGPRRADIPEDHCAGLVAYIADRLDIDLPLPAYHASLLRHFIGYRNSEQQGPYRAPVDGEGSWVTGKVLDEANLLGQRFWGFEGAGNPRQYNLVASGRIVRVSRWRRPNSYVRGGRSYGLRVHFKHDSSEPVEVSNFPWFKRLLKQQQSFRHGFNRLTDLGIAEELTKVSSGESAERQPDRSSDLRDIDRRVRSETTRVRLHDARLGQGTFRSDVAKLFGWQCGVTACSVREILRASHIKPWSISSDRERLDPHNGLMLAAHIDALFDRGLVSFKSNGDMLVSARISSKERKRLKIPTSLRYKLTTVQTAFLAHHRRLHQFDRRP